MSSVAHVNKYFNRSLKLFKIFDSKNEIFSIAVLTKNAN